MHAHICDKFLYTVVLFLVNFKKRAFIKIDTTTTLGPTSGMKYFKRVLSTASQLALFLPHESYVSWDAVESASKVRSAFEALRT